MLPTNLVPEPANSISGIITSVLKLVETFILHWEVIQNCSKRFDSSQMVRNLFLDMKYS